MSHFGDPPSPPEEDIPLSRSRRRQSAQTLSHVTCHALEKRPPSQKQNSATPPASSTTACAISIRRHNLVTCHVSHFANPPARKKIFSSPVAADASLTSVGAHFVTCHMSHFVKETPLAETKLPNSVRPPTTPCATSIHRHNFVTCHMSRFVTEAPSQRENSPTPCVPPTAACALSIPRHNFVTCHVSHFGKPPPARNKIFVAPSPIENRNQHSPWPIKLF
jgi:hypothetical protein